MFASWEPLLDCEPRIPATRCSSPSPKRAAGCGCCYDPMSAARWKSRPSGRLVRARAFRRWLRSGLRWRRHATARVKLLAGHLPIGPGQFRERRLVLARGVVRVAFRRRDVAVPHPLLQRPHRHASVVHRIPNEWPAACTGGRVFALTFALSLPAVSTLRAHLAD
jgi:hypothetical protein